MEWIIFIEDEEYKINADSRWSAKKLGSERHILEKYPKSGLPPTAFAYLAKTKKLGTDWNGEKTESDPT